MVSHRAERLKMIYRKPNNTKIYRQGNEKWASLPYPTKNYSFGGSGCGACAVLHCIIERPKYRNYTPFNVQPYMKQYAVKGHGTKWIGIEKGLRHWGMLEVKELATMAPLWVNLKKGNKVAVLLMNNNLAPDKTRYTSGGHYIAAVGYKEKNGKHYLYLKDSGGRHNDKWKCYETSIMNCVSKVWVCTVPREIALPECGYWKKGDKDPEIKKIQSFLKKEGDYSGLVGGRLGTLTERAINIWKEKNGLDPNGKWDAECNRKADE